MGDRRCEALRERALPATDLEHDVFGTELRVADDRVEQVPIGEEVLAEAP